MSQFPNFSSYGYRVIKELGANRSGGRVTYLASDLNTRTRVVIKEFQFARTGSSWAEYDAYKREIEVLQGLNHPGIPQYLHSFQTRDGFCMVQEYKDAQPLSKICSFNLTEIRQIAIAILEILVYLQNRIPPIIHRDLKPDNILIGEKLQVYLIDFGFARAGEGEVGVSSVVKGTLGFMPPEQLFNRQLTEASDLYGLGMTLICLMTGTKSTEVGSLVDITYKVNFREVLPRVSPHWINWLERMVEPRLKNRFPNARAALDVLPQETFYAPEAQFSQSKLSFIATQPRQKLTQTITICNSVPETLLRGEWEVSSHPSDPVPVNQTHAWIAVEPASFASNQVDCQITIDTRKLANRRLFRRELRLHTNAVVHTYTVDIHVQTAAVTLELQKFPYAVLVILFGFLAILAYGFAWTLISFGNAALAVHLGATIGSAIGLVIAAVFLETLGASTGTNLSVIVGFVLGAIALFLSSTGQLFNSFDSALVGALIGVVPGGLTGVAVGVAIETLTRRTLHPALATTLAFLTAVTAFSFGMGVPLGLSQLGILLPLLGAGTPLLGLLSYHMLKRLQTLSDYREAQRHLIKP